MNKEPVPIGKPSNCRRIHPVDPSLMGPRPARYRRKPLEVTAVQVWEPIELPDHPNGCMTARPGDWLITGPDGGRWICEQEIFPLIYEAI